jgi:hypothetical protein
MPYLTAGDTEVLTPVFCSIATHGPTLDTHDTKSNESAMKTGLRLLSSYEMKGGEKPWVITEAIDLQSGEKSSQRQLTTLLLPSDY